MMLEAFLIEPAENCQICQMHTNGERDSSLPALVTSSSMAPANGAITAASPAKAFTKLTFLILKLDPGQSIMNVNDG